MITKIDRCSQNTLEFLKLQDNLFQKFITKVLIAKVKDLKENSNLSVTQIAKLTEKSRATIYKVLKNELVYVSNRLVKQEGINEAK